MTRPLFSLLAMAALWLPACATPLRADVAAATAGAETAAPAPPAPAPPTPATSFARAISAARAGDTATAAALFLPLARTGDAQAQFNLALLFYDGRGLPQNHAEALYWAWRARLGGVQPAQTLIARMADAATPDLRKTLATRIEADLEPRVKVGEGRAMLELSFVLSDLLPDPDLPRAYVWQALSAAFETPNAVTARNATYAALKPEDRPKAQAQAMEQLKSLCATGLTDPVCEALF